MKNLTLNHLLNSGNGISQFIFDRGRSLIRRALDFLTEDSRCEPEAPDACEGCPQCILSTQCDGYNVGIVGMRTRCLELIRSLNTRLDHIEGAVVGGRDDDEEDDRRRPASALSNSSSGSPLAATYYKIESSHGWAHHLGNGHEARE